MEGSTTVAQLEKWLEELTRRWERYMTGDPQVPLPPERERAALERRLRDMSRVDSPSTSEQFRQDALLHRFAMYNQLWQRQLRQKEEARVAAGQARRVAAASANETASPTVHDEEGEYRALHERFLGALRSSGAVASVGFERFRETLIAQKSKLEEKGASVEGFDVVSENGQVKLRARVRRRST